MYLRGMYNSIIRVRVVAINCLLSAVSQAIPIFNGNHLSHNKISMTAVSEDFLMHTAKNDRNYDFR